MCFRILSLEIRLKLLEKIMFGNKLPLNEASCFDPQLEPENLQVSNQLFH